MANASKEVRQSRVEELRRYFDDMIDRIARADGLGDADLTLPQDLELFDALDKISTTLEENLSRWNEELDRQEAEFLSVSTADRDLQAV